ncbi:hypothetical protein PV08_09988 [Exophiala spinifera]|uniref:AB hydrolase-1 domain-containing protein n=1 Tax=Exophiala spinifera TaxID=91928 RepID=A0A0D2B272_9EURO|nr:uncharacterized protein PV08_09988 [Exophiala spinifera]KIW12710.1 hypothetical protein PV08_09988 [Exophiala spinifera]
MKPSFFTCITWAAALLGCAARAVTAAPGSRGLAIPSCHDLMLPLSISANNTNIVGVDQTFNNQSYATGTILQLTGTAKAWGSQHISGFFINNKTYNIHAKYCEPANGANVDSPLIVAVHGPGVNLKYWDFDLSPEYSLIKQAVAKGYPILAYDRLGAGLSDSTSNGFNEPQIATEIEILANILTQAKGGSIAKNIRFSKIVGVGHSYGSFQLQGITKIHPELVDAVVLTAYSADSSNAAEFLLGSNYVIARDTSPAKFGHRPSYWLTTPTDAADLTTFFWPPNSDPAALSIWRNQTDVIALGAYTTISAVTGMAPNFHGLVHVITGDKDLSACGYNCSGPDGRVAQVAKFYPSDQVNFTYSIVNDTGHGIVPHYSGPGVIQDILTYIEKNFIVPL